MSRTIVAALATLLALACASSSTDRPAPPGCRADHALVGTWRDGRLSELGSAWMTVTLRCDCTYRTTVQLLFFRLSENGTWRSDADAIVFERRSGATRWPYSFDGPHLWLTEGPGDKRRYARSGQEQCAPAS